MRDPAFWWTDRSAAATLLAPLGACYGAIVARRMARPGRKVPVPVICVGNFTLGGGGKAPARFPPCRPLVGFCPLSVFSAPRLWGGGRGPGPGRKSARH